MFPSRNLNDVRFDSLCQAKTSSTNPFPDLHFLVELAPQNASSRTDLTDAALCVMVSINVLVCASCILFLAMLTPSFRNRLSLQRDKDSVHAKGTRKSHKKAERENLSVSWLLTKAAVF